MKNKPLPQFFFTLGHLVWSVGATVAYCLLFIWIFNPFSNVEILALEQFRSTSGYVWFWLSSTIVIFLARWIRISVSPHKAVYYSTIIPQWLTELLIIGYLYLLFSNLSLFPGRHISIKMLLETTFYISIMVSIPFSLVTLITALWEKSRDYKALEAGVQAQQLAPDMRQIHFFDHKDEYKFSLRSDNIYYAVAQDNYIQICYEEEGQTQNYLLRCPISKFEQEISGSRLARCHRSYIVNLDHVSEFIKSHNTATIVLDNPSLQTVPVSKSYYNILPASIVGGKDSSASYL